MTAFWLIAFIALVAGEAATASLGPARVTLPSSPSSQPKNWGLITTGRVTVKCSSPSGTRMMSWPNRSQTS